MLAVPKESETHAKTDGVLVLNKTTGQGRREQALGREPREYVKKGNNPVAMTFELVVETIR